MKSWGFLFLNTFFQTDLNGCLAAVNMKSLWFCFAGLKSLPVKMQPGEGMDNNETRGLGLKGAPLLWMGWLRACFCSWWGLGVFWWFSLDWGCSLCSLSAWAASLSSHFWDFEGFSEILFLQVYRSKASVNLESQLHWSWLRWYWLTIYLPNLCLPKVSECWLKQCYKFDQYSYFSLGS